ncbi:unnamed protein product [Arabidopsis arenosa]|uniref:Uncharacterized protein n=1 Tax=Arabidopsis arenosa TaxID=38785 RepID=A0A8S1ZIE2_ARAAE|nr:unnamed protein product [Arabidopsis arenosa]
MFDYVSCQSYPEEFEDIVETSVESDEVVPLVDLGGNLGSVPVSNFVVLSDDSMEDFSDEFEEPEKQVATGFLFGDSGIDEPMWKGPDGVLYEFNSDDSWQPGVHTNPYYYPPSSDSLSTMDSFSSMSLGQTWVQALAYNMVPPSEVFATPPGPPSPVFVELSSDDELADVEESGIPNFMKAESLRMSTPPRKFATRTWYPGYYGEEGVESSHANLENLVGDQVVPDVTANCETLFTTPLTLELVDCGSSG